MESRIIKKGKEPKWGDRILRFNSIIKIRITEFASISGIRARTHHFILNICCRRTHQTFIGSFTEIRDARDDILGVIKDRFNPRSPSHSWMFLFEIVRPIWQRVTCSICAQGPIFGMSGIVSPFPRGPESGNRLALDTNEWISGGFTLPFRVEMKIKRILYSGVIWFGNWKANFLVFMSIFFTFFPGPLLGCDNWSRRLRVQSVMSRVQVFRVSRFPIWCQRIFPGGNEFCQWDFTKKTTISITRDFNHSNRTPRKGKFIVKLNLEVILKNTRKQ